MKVSDVGERALVELARKTFKIGPRIKVGIGDDAAAIDIDGRYLIATTDMLIAGTHFPPGTTAEQMGHKAVIVNLSDLAAMGAEPLALIFSVGLPRGLDVEFVKRMIKSMDLTAGRYETYVVGGDLDESDDITIAGAAFGLASKRKLLTRSGSKPGDVIAVTGQLGAASAGLKILLERLPPKGYEKLIKAQLEPIARVREGMALAKNGVKAAIDITDSLASNLWQVSRMSGTKLIIDREKVPVHPLALKFAERYRFKVDNFALYGGEDFELLFTVRPRSWRRVKLALGRIGTKVTAIGHVTKGRGVFVQRKGIQEKLPDRGYEHFRYRAVYASTFRH
jgi:thiamine-monophosphate kinase